MAGGGVAGALGVQGAPKAFKVYVPGYKQLCVGVVATEGGSSSRLVFKPADASDPEVMWAKRILPDQTTFELINLASGQRIYTEFCHPAAPYMLIWLFPIYSGSTNSQLVVSAYYHPALLFAPALWMEAENAGGGVADGGVQIVCASARVQRQTRLLLPLKIAEWGANNPQHGNNDGQMMLEAEEEHDAASEEEEDDEDGGAEEVTASPPSSKRSRCCYGCIRRLFACL